MRKDTIVNQEVKENIVNILEQDIKMNPVDLQETRDYFANTLYQSDISEFLFVKFLDGNLYKPRYKYVLNQVIGKSIARLGNKEYKYADLVDVVGDRAINADNTMEDFNGDYTQEYAEVFVFDFGTHRKAKIPGNVLSNAWLEATRMIEFVQLQVEAQTKAIEKVWENRLWTKLVEEAEVVESTGTSIHLSSQINLHLKEFGTTSRVHRGIGENGVITINTPTKGEVSIQPELYFNPTDFVLIFDVALKNDLDFQYEAQWFNYSITKGERQGIQKIALDFTKYSGFEEVKKQEGSETFLEAVNLPANTKAILIHKDALDPLYQYSETSSVKGASDFTVQHFFTKLGIYRVKTLPMLIYTLTEEEITEPTEPTDPEGE